MPLIVSKFRFMQTKHGIIKDIEMHIRDKNPDYAEYIINEAYSFMRKRYLSRKYYDYTANDLILLYYKQICKQLNLNIHENKAITKRA